MGSTLVDGWYFSVVSIHLAIPFIRPMSSKSREGYGLSLSVSTLYTFILRKTLMEPQSSRSVLDVQACSICVEPMLAAS